MENDKKNIWVVSSDEQLRELASAVLSEKGYKVTGFKNPADMKDALGKIKDFREVPATIIADYTNEKKGDAVQVIKAAKEFLSPIPVIIQSGDNHIREQMVSDGAAGFIQNPYGDGNKSLLDTVEMVVRSNKKESIWIVNDNPVLSDKIKKVLGEDRYNFVVFDKHQDAIDVLDSISGDQNKKKPDLIIADSTNVNGMKVAKKASEIGGIRTIIESSTNVESLAKSNGAMGFILRSDIVTTLENAVTDALNKPAPAASRKTVMSR